MRSPDYWTRWRVVPRDLRWPLPEGWLWCGPMVAGRLDRYGGESFTLRDDLWPQEVQQRMAGAVLVSAVRGDLSPLTVFHWPEPKDPHRIDRFNHISPREPRLLEYPRGGAVLVTGGQALRGEVLAWPVERITLQEAPRCSAD